MNINELIKSIEGVQKRNDFVEYLNNNISDIESVFYTSDYQTINNVKFTIADFVYSFEDKALIKKDDESSSVKAFIIILADFYDRFRLRGEINVIYNFTPECSVKKRLDSSKMYLGFSNVNQYYEQFDDVIELLNSAYVDDDLGYRARISLMNYFLHVKEILQEKYPNNFSDLANLFYTEKGRYEILDDENIQKLVSNGVSIEFKQLENEIEKLHSIVIDKNNYVNITIPPTPEPEIINEEGGDYASAYNSSPIKNFNTIQNLSIELGNINDENFNRLERGTAVIDDEILLNQYIYSFGRMHKAKLLDAFDKIPWERFEENNNCIDWGCGQALASVVLHDYLVQHNLKIQFDKLLLIEPSDPALKRGLLHANALPTFNEVRPLNKYIEFIEIEDIDFIPPYNTLHLFSNILDVPKFDINKLCYKISETGQLTNCINHFICVSPNIDDLRSNRIESFYNYWLKNNYTTELFSGRQSNLGRWTRYEKVFSVCV